MVADNRTKTNRSEPASEKDPQPDSALHTRRDVVRRGVRLAFVPPIVSTLFAKQAYAANYSCYGLGHVCQDIETDPEPCCSGLQCTGPPPKTCK